MDELAKRIAELSDKVGPQAMDAARGAVRVEAYSSLAVSVFFLVIAMFLAPLARYVWKKDEELDGDGMFKIFACIVAGTALSLILVGVWQWIDPWTWTAIYHPDIYLAKKVLKL